MKPPLQNDHKIVGLFPIPLYVVNRNSDLDSTEEKEIEDIIEEGMHKEENWTTHNTYIFNTKLKKIKQFCEKHIDNYVKEILNPKEETNYYITQSWFNITKPGDFHPSHSHSNSIISGTFYISTAKGDKITLNDPNIDEKERGPQSEPKEFNMWNHTELSFTVENNMLLLFPSWMVHNVPINESAETRMTIAFNTFAKGRFGIAFNRNELILS